MSLKSKASNIGFIFFGLIGILPFFAAFIYALLYSFGIVGAANSGFTTEFWVSIWQSGAFLRSLVYSTAVAGTSIIISVSLALWLTLKFRKELELPFLSFAMYIPLAIPGIVAAFFTFQLLAKAGFFSRIAYAFGWITEARQFPDLVNDPYAIGIIATFISIVTPFFLLLFLNVYKNERVEELTQLSQSLGANNQQTVWRVSLPVLLNKTWTLIGLYFIFLLGAYEVPLILGQESPQMLSVLIIREIKQYDLSRLSEGYVVAVIYTVIVTTAAVLLFSRKNDVRHEG